MPQNVTIIKHFGLSNCTVVKLARKNFTEYVVARNLTILEGELKTGQTVKCYWGSGTYCDSREAALKIAIQREQDVLDELKEELEEDFDSLEDDFESNAPCDTYGMCAGTSCSQYYTVCHKPEAYRDPFN